jgi:DinB family protein
MNGVDSQKETLALVHAYLEGAFSGCEGETLTRTLPGATVGSIGSIYLHALASEDWAIQELLQGRPKLIDSGDWFERLGMEPAKDPDWSQANMDLPVMQELAQMIYGSTDAYLNSITDADLDKQIPWHSGQTHTAGWVLADVIHAHLGTHAGEIAALKGVMGLQGLPW